MMQQFDLYTTLQVQLPYRNRKSRFIAWIKVFASYLNTIMTDHFQYWETTVRDAKMTPQICYIEKFLNDRFSTTEIRIVDGRELGPWMFIGGPPSGDVDMFMVEPDNYIFSNGVTISIGFVVEVPSSLINDCNMIAAYVQKYKLPGKSFIIQLV